jgi:xylose dehydrogenase (NAD/NADP)
MDLDDVLTDVHRRDWQRTDPDTVKPVRFAVIGLGWFTRGHALPALEDSDRCEATTLVSSTTEKAKRVAEEFEGPKHGITYDEFREGTVRDAYDAVYVVTPNALHLPYVTAAAEFGKDVLCEKPIERDSHRARELVDTCDRAGVALMIAYRMHTEPAVRRARELISEGALGEPVAVHGSMSQRLLDRVNPDTSQWRLDEELAGGGALFDLGVYPLNTTRFLLDADPVAVTGKTQNTHNAFDEVDETASFMMNFPSNVQASCFASHNARQHSTIRVTGTEGSIAVKPAFFQDRERALHISRGDGRATVAVDKVDQMREEFDYFADRIRSDADIYPDGEHGLVDLEAMEAVYEAEEREAWVSLG